MFPIVKIRLSWECFISYNGNHQVDKRVPLYWSSPQISWSSRHLLSHFPVDGLMQERRNSIANALELHLSCTDPSLFDSTMLCSFFLENLTPWGLVYMYFFLIFLLFFRHFSCSETAVLQHNHDPCDWRKILISLIFTNLIHLELHVFTMTTSRYKVVAFRPAARLHVHYPQTSINSTISVTQSGPALATVDPTPPYPVNGHHRLGNKDLINRKLRPIISIFHKICAWFYFLLFCSGNVIKFWDLIQYQDVASPV